MDEYYRRLKALPRAQGVDEILMPGEPEMLKEKEALELGIMISGKILDDLHEAAELYHLNINEFFNNRDSL